jgi:hypothetical protein
MRDHPWQTVSNGFRKVVDAFGWLPSPRRSFWPNLVHAISYGSIMIPGLMGMWASRMHWPEHSIFYAQFLSFALVTAVFFGHTAYRAYLDVYLIVFAAAFLATLRVGTLRKQIRMFGVPEKVTPDLSKFRAKPPPRPDFKAIPCA